MIKRGPVVMIVGIVMIITTFVIAYSVMPTVQDEENLLLGPENLFDSVTEKQVIEPGSTITFSHTVTTSQVPLMWGLHILDYTSESRVSINISNLFGDKLGSFDDADPVFVKTFDIPKVDTFSFNVENKGTNPVTAVMMFTENPEKSKALTDPNSTFHKSIIPLAIAGFFLIIGIIALIVGIILSVVDWKKGKNQSRYI
jgi:hypothetical protein